MRTCLMCGSEPSEPYAGLASIDARTYESKPAGAWAVDCGNDECNFYVGFFKTEKEAIEAWENQTLVTVDEHKKSMDEARKLVDKFFEIK